MANVYFIERRYYGEPSRQTADDVVASKNYFDHGSGQLEDLDSRARNLESVLGRLIGVLVEKEVLGNQEIRQILGSDYSIEGRDDG